MNNFILVASICLLPVAVTSAQDVTPQSTGWPIEPTNAEHPLGNTLGEFQLPWRDANPKAFQHQGIDILAQPHDPNDPGNPAVPWVTVTVGGTVKSLNVDSVSTAGDVEINGVDGVLYRYAHLDFIDPTIVEAFKTPGTDVLIAGQHIAQVVQYGCPYDHLHYDMSANTLYFNPLASISPDPDDDAPTVDVFLASHASNPWNEFKAVAPACKVVRGRVDIIAQLVDRDDAGSTAQGANNVGVFDLHWRVCPNTAPDCPAWNTTHPFVDMPTDWENTGNTGTQEQFGTAHPWSSDYNECSKAVSPYFMIPTRNSASGGWNATAAGGYPDGSYSVSVLASDIAGNTTTKTVHACVQNVTACTTDLAIRDGPMDVGAVPSQDDPFWLSPDITTNPGTPQEDKNIKLGSSNQVVVTVWNVGSCPLPVGTPYTVCLAWNPPSGSVPFPIPPSQVVGCQNDTVLVGEWSPGTSRQSTFSWTPPVNSLPLGHNCLVAWTDMGADTVQSSPSVVLDNNRAQRNISFEFAPAPTSASTPDPATQSAQSFWVYPISGMQERDIEIQFKASDAGAYLRTANLVVPPIVRITRVVGADLTVDSACRHVDGAALQSCTVALSGVGSRGRIRLEGIQLERPGELQLQVTTAQQVPPGTYIDANIVEYGAIERAELLPIGGVTLRFEGVGTR